MVVVFLGVDVAAYFVQNGGHLEQQPVVAAQAVQLLQLVKEHHGEPAYLLAVCFIHAVVVGQQHGKVHHFILQRQVIMPPGHEIAQEGVGEFLCRAHDAAWLEITRYGQVDKHGGQQGTHAGIVFLVLALALVGRGGGNLVS